MSLPHLATVKSLTLEDGAFLSVFGKNCVYFESVNLFTGRSHETSTAGRYAADANVSEYAVVLNVLGDVVMKGASSLAVGGFNMLRKTVFYVGGDLTLEDTSTLAVYPGFPSAATAAEPTLEEHIAGGARLDVIGNLTVSSGAKLQLHNHHTSNSGCATLLPVIVTAKKVTVEEGATVESLLGGEFRQAQMRSLSDNNSDNNVRGGGHGGIGGGGDGTATTQGGYRSYDNMYAPLYPGAYGRVNSGVGGGTIRIHADFVKIAGVLDVSSKIILNSGYEMGGSAGGSIWITSRGAIQVLETAELLARGQDGLIKKGNSTGRGGGAGGRIALCRNISDEKLHDLYATGDTEKTKKFDIADEEVRSSVNFSGSIDVSGGLPVLSGQAGGVGTAYLLDGREVGFSVIIR